MGLPLGDGPSCPCQGPKNSRGAPPLRFGSERRRFRCRRHEIRRGPTTPRGQSRRAGHSEVLLRHFEVLWTRVDGRLPLETAAPTCRAV